MSDEMRLFNTLTGRVEPFAPERPPEVRMYVCGPTVYNRAHLGNFRTFVATDVLRRALEFRGHSVCEVMNLTDVEDRIIRFAADASTDLEGYTRKWIDAFHADMAMLRMERPEHFPKATDHIGEMIDLISRLIERGHTYTADGSVYFRISTQPSYGQLSRLDVSGIRAGARVDTDRYDKEDARDFVLWKLKADEPSWAQWDAPFGKGRPGWHIECSAMAMKYLGETFDLHCGGVDLVFPHHENEIAQSEGGTGHPFVRTWVHVEHLLVEGETMSKSKGNFFTIPDLVDKGHRPDAIRYLLASVHYRKQLNFTFEGLAHATAALERIHSLVRRLDEASGDGPVGEADAACGQALSRFGAALGDDLNVSEALAAVHGLVGEANALMATNRISRAGAERVRQTLASMDSVFAVFFPEDRSALTPDEQALFDERQAARVGRDFVRADSARARLDALGIVLEDTPKGTRWRRRG